MIKELILKNPSVIRGNPSEILMCVGQMGISIEKEDGLAQKGADSLVDSTAVPRDAVDELARKVTSERNGLSVVQLRQLLTDLMLLEFLASSCVVHRLEE